ncbi:MAG TPA: sigma-70 family RNA polymerase sigma factor [Solirubrobacteraceae bacterium]
MGTVGGSETELLARLRAGDEAAFRALVTRHNGAMRRLALTFVPTSSVADEVVQETWLAVIRGLKAFEQRSSLKTWIFRILVNRAQSRGVRERRTTPFSSLGDAESGGGPTVDPDRFLPRGTTFDGYWSVSPSRFFELPEDQLLARETAELVAAAINALPARQEQVIRLRDIEGWHAEEVCESLGISSANQRVLLHRARASVRVVLEGHFAEVTV